MHRYTIVLPTQMTRMMRQAGIVLLFVLLSVPYTWAQGTAFDGTTIPATPETITDSSIYLPAVQNHNQAVEEPGGTQGPQTYYLSPQGNDARSGLSPQNAWATFERAWQSMKAGDTLILLDGVYMQQMRPTISGLPGSYVTIRAQNDGQATIDGQYQYDPVSLDHPSLNTDAYLIIEGINMKNGPHATLRIEGKRHVIVRRFHAYNEFVDYNDTALDPGWAVAVLLGSKVQLEDCVASGSGIKMMKLFASNHVTVRRCLFLWNWNNAHTDHNGWPWNGGLNIYHTGNSIFENVIAMGTNPDYGINFHGLERDKDPNDPNGDNSPVDHNKYLGSMALGIGTTPDGKVYDWSIPIRPQPNTESPPNRVFTWEYGNARAGFQIEGNIADTLFKDILAYGNAGLGFARHYAGPNLSTNTVIENATFVNNGLDAPSIDGGLGKSVDFRDWQSDMIIKNSYVDGEPQHTGPGADIFHRYVNGVKTNEPLWPWPMEERIQRELGFSLTNKVADVVDDINANHYNMGYTIPRVSTNGFPNLGTSKTYIPFPKTFVGSSNTQSLEITNTGEVPLEIAKIDIVNDRNSGVFTTTGTPCTTVPAGGSCTLTLQFTPTGPDFFTGRVAIYPANQGAAAHPWIVSLLGIGHPKPGEPYTIPGEVPLAYPSAYHDVSAGNASQIPTFGDLDAIPVILDNRQAFKIGYISDGEWLEYPVEVQQTATYRINALIASASSRQNGLQVYLDNSLIAAVDPPFTGSWHVYQETAIGAPVTLTQGRHTLRLAFQGGDFDLARLQFVVQSKQMQPSPTPLAATPAATPTSTPTRAVSPSPTPALNHVNTPGEGLVTNLAVSSGRTYVIDVLDVGKPIYIDRSYTFALVPPELAGQSYIRTANDDKRRTESDYLRFNLTAPATVYVAVDERMSILPAWLEDWHLSNEMLGTTDNGLRRRLYWKHFPAGKVILGGNAMPPMAGAGSNYTIVVVPDDVSAVTPTPTLTPTPTRTPFSTYTPTMTPTRTPTPPPTPSPTYTPTPASRNIQMTLQLDRSSTYVDGMVTATIQIVSGSYPVDGAAAYLDFDPNILQVINITPGDRLSTILEKSWDNRKGQLNYAAGLLGSATQGTFTLLTVTFQAVGRSPGTALEFARQTPRRTEVTYHGESVLDHAQGNTISVTGIKIIGQVQLEGRPTPPNPRWTTPLKVTLFDPNAASSKYTFVKSTDEQGIFVLTGIEPGIYYLAVKNEHTLQRVHEVSVTDTIQVDLGVLPEGDAVQDNVINLLDFSKLAGSFGQCIKASADFNEDGCVNLQDFSLLAKNFGKHGDEIPGANGSHAALEIGVLPPASMNSEIRVPVWIDAEDLLVDAAALYLSFDPKRHEVVDLHPGVDLETILESEFDNEFGTISIAAGSLNRAKSGRILLATLTLRSLANQTGAGLEMYVTGNKRSGIAFQGRAHPFRAVIEDGSIVLHSMRPTSQSVYLPVVGR